MVAAGEHLSSSRPVRRAKARPAARIPLCVEPPPCFAEGPGPSRDWWEKALSEKSFSGRKRGESQQNQGVGANSRTTHLGPFGEVIRATGPMAKLNPFLFQTAFYDWETGFYSYIFRYYNPSTGRWIGRDPSEEEGGPNLYGFAGNDPVDFYDILGLAWSVSRTGRARAIATPQSGDTVASLATQLSLNANEYQLWLKPSGPTQMPASANTPINGCSQFLVPNTCYIDLGQLKWYDHVGIGNSIVQNFQAKATALFSTWTSAGFNAVLTPDVGKATMSSHLGDSALYYYVFAGHGAENGIINGDNGLPPWKYTSYGIASMQLLACYSLQWTLGHPANWNFTQSPWQWNVSVLGTLSGYTIGPNNFSASSLITVPGVEK
jgi:RHS repeat-associated protein